MAFPVSPTTGDEYTAPSGAVYVFTSYGAWRVADGQTDFSVLSSDDKGDIFDVVKELDGADSLLDADLLDGQEGAYYADIPARLGFTPFNAAHIATGFSTICFNAAAPTGWTKSTSNDNKALRIVSGTGGAAGGTAPFTTVFAARTILEANLPPHAHAAGSLGGTAADHTHPYNDKSVPNSGVGTTGSGGISDMAAADTARITGNSGALALSITGSTGNGAGTSTAMDFAVQYVDAIVIVKD